MSGRQHKRELKRQREAARAAARRKERQATLFTGVVIAIVVAIGAVIIVVTVREEQAAERAAAEAASEAASEQATAAATPVAERPVACGGELPPQAGQDKPTFDEPEQVLDEGVDYQAVVRTSCGTVRLDLLEKDAPETVNSFVFLAREGFFDGLAIFRNATSIGALQTGSGTNDPSWDIGYTLPDELKAAKRDGYPPGTAAMANAGPGTGGSQFFFVYNNRFRLPPQYSVFARADRKGTRVLRRIGGIAVEAPDADPPDPRAEAPGKVAWIESVVIEPE